jgi:hypothetical protein
MAHAGHPAHRPPGPGKARAADRDAVAMTGDVTRRRAPGEAPELLAGRDAQHRVRRPAKVAAGTRDTDLARAPAPAAAALVPVRLVTAGAVPVTGNVQAAANSALVTAPPPAASSARAGDQLGLEREGLRMAAGTAGIATPSPAPGEVRAARKARLRTREPGRALGTRLPGDRTSGHHAVRAVAARPAGHRGTGDPPHATAAGPGAPAGLATSDARTVRDVKTASDLRKVHGVRMATGARAVNGAGATIRAEVTTVAAMSTRARVRIPAAARTPGAAMTAGGATTAARRARASAGSTGTATAPTIGVHVQMRRDVVPDPSLARRFLSRSAHSNSTLRSGPS